MKIVKKTIKKAQTGTKVPVSTVKRVSDSLKTVGGQKIKASINRTTRADGPGYDDISQKLNKSGIKNIETANRYDKLITKSKKRNNGNKK